MLAKCKEYKNMETNMISDPSLTGIAEKLALGGRQELYYIWMNFAPSNS